ncbi:hypothetical protein Q9L58_000533 [Maublancomyces gigas]|uniref:Thioesterase family protein n=1 Tax=Discina gigas TaxID=1032678 RepID=A0ABR3GWJ9_9PEZI
MPWKNKPTFDADFQHSGFTAAIATSSESGSGVYNADLKRDWCIGFVPHGGYLTALLLSASTDYMQTHPSLAPLDQPHPIHIAVSFFRACVPGPALVTLTPVKTGRAYTFLRASLTQGTDVRLESVLAFTNLTTLQHGPTLATLPERPTPHRLRDCVQPEPPLGRIIDVRPAMWKLRYRVPRGAADGSTDDVKCVREQWVSLVDGERIVTSTLGFLADMFQPLPENYPETVRSNWYPTLSLSIEIKRVAPPEGWEWLFCRVHSREIRNGRMDINVDIFDEESRLVAVAHQVAIIVTSDRNRPRGGEQKEGGKGKGEGVKL